MRLYLEIEEVVTLIKKMRYALATQFRKRGFQRAPRVLGSWALILGSFTEKFLRCVCNVF